MNQSNQPLVSVVIPCYNHENFVQDSIQSVIDQTYQNIELIIIDDGSKDGSVEKVQEMLPACKERFVRFEFRHRTNKGLSATLNEALEWCEGEYYSAFASDDIMLSQKIEVQVGFFNESFNSNILGVFGGYELIDQYNNILNTSLKKYEEYAFNEIFMHQFELPAPSSLLKISKVREIGGYDPNIKIEDWYMWLKMTESGGKLVYLPKILCRYRSHLNNFSKNIEVLQIEREKVVNSFKHYDLYDRAKININWYKATDCSKVSKIESIKEGFKIVFNRPSELISRNFVRFLYYLVCK
ncbi:MULTISPECIES: glycosyltransferase [unclassified Acinetobacter]|uniref:glycosyltransferase family 2 protein n=1 Tax=unclassified Acinetobacter TaxID=196816 RepID=UPI0028829ED4|nr:MULTISPECIES: glycosyltransferase [unclassified Acinetobacter]MDT0198984.1 glycosyltransferase [Acinetobacter sp. RG5]MDT0230626.1 glycosyltransferase [Acinetobacter sp. RRD8]